MSWVDSYGPGIALAAICGAMIHSGYRQCNPTIDDLKQRAERRERAGRYNVEIGRSMMEAQDKQLDWERRCLEAGKILDK
jgi:hypothetical protein